MEHSQKNTDCYFFYYSTCLKGDACAFRHEPSALGCETMCSYWQQGNCLNEHCNFRHMELKKNRKSIPCYWETQPSGCRKPHCCFMHKNARGPAVAEPINPGRNNDLPSKPISQEWSNRQEHIKYDADHRATIDGNSTESEQGRGSSETGSFINSPAVDPLVVNFEEESDNESLPSPTKPQSRYLHVKTLEEIKLERIQAESAAYYNYESEDDGFGLLGAAPDVAGASALERDLRARLAKRLYTGKQRAENSVDNDKGNEARTNLDFEILSLDEIRKRRRDASDGDGTSRKVARTTSSLSATATATATAAAVAAAGMSDFGVKSLMQIRALKAASRARRGNSPRSDDSAETERRSGGSTTMFGGGKDLAVTAIGEAFARFGGSSGDENTSGTGEPPRPLEARIDNVRTVTTGRAPPPVRLRRPERSGNEKRVTGYDDRTFTGQDATVNQCDSSQDASPERLSLEASPTAAPSRRTDDRPREHLNGTRTNDTVTNGNSAASDATTNEPRTTGSRTSFPSVSDDDFLMYDATTTDHAPVPDNILRDIDELLND